MSENEIRVLYVQPGKYPEERIIPNTLSASQKLVGGNIECVARGEIASALSAMILERLTSYHLTVFMDIQTFLQALFSFVVVAGGILSA